MFLLCFLFSCEFGDVSLRQFHTSVYAMFMFVVLITELPSLCQSHPLYYLYLFPVTHQIIPVTILLQLPALALINLVFHRLLPVKEEMPSAMCPGK